MAGDLDFVPTWGLFCTIRATDGDDSTNTTIQLGFHHENLFTIKPGEEESLEGVGKAP
jgi:hypothetical protein